MSPRMIRPLQKIFAGLATGLVMMAGALPAIGQVNAIQVEFMAPGQEAEIRGTTTITVKATSSAQGVKTGGMIKDLTIRIQPDGGTNGDVCHAGDSPGLCVTKNYEAPTTGVSQAGAEETLDLEWRTKEVSPANGVWDVVSVARPDAPGVNNGVKILQNLKVNNPPERPDGLAVSKPERGNPRLSVTWSKNSEVDLTGYRIYRATGDGPFVQQKTTLGRDAVSFQDEGLPFDKPIRYQLVAVRPSPVDGEIVSPAATTSAVTIESPPPPPSPSPSSTPGGVKASPSTSGGSPLKDLSGKLGTPDASGRAVKPVSLAAPNSITGPRRDGGSGFGRLLPFGKDAPQSLIDEEFAEAVGEAIRNPGRVISQELRVNPLRFIAAAVLLFVTAGHLGRGAQSLFRSARSATSSASPVIPA